MAAAKLPVFLATIILTLHHHQSLIITASPLAPLSLFATTNTTTPATAAAANNLECFDSSDWVTWRFLAGDCFSAIGIFQDGEVERHSSTVYEFLSSTLVPAYPQFTMSTPRRYTYRSCTMTIAMLTDLAAAGIQVPHLPTTRTWSRTDLSDYRAVLNAILNVRDGCLSVILDAGGGGGNASHDGGGGEGSGLGFSNPVGYNTVGVHGAIGVFLWDTGSVINQAVKGGTHGISTIRS